MDIKILQIAADTKNNKEIKNFTHKSKNKNPLCGDEIEISLIVKNKKILDLGYQCKSCIYCEASASLLSKLVIKKSLDKINELSIFVSDFLKKIIQNFQKNGNHLKNFLIRRIFQGKNVFYYLSKHWQKP